MDKSRIIAIKDCDMFQGDGISVSVWFGGCNFHCDGCFNKDTWSMSIGEEYTSSTEDFIIELLTKHKGTKKNLTLLGGEPLLERNFDVLKKLIERAKPVSNKIWLWTGYEFNDIPNFDVIKDVDYIVCGKYIKELHKPTIYCGSSNQRVIDVKKSLETNTIVELYK